VIKQWAQTLQESAPQLLMLARHHHYKWCTIGISPISSDSWIAPRGAARLGGHQNRPKKEEKLKRGILDSCSCRRVHLASDCRALEVPSSACQRRFKLYKKVRPQQKNAFQKLSTMSDPASLMVGFTGKLICGDVWTAQGAQLVWSALPPKKGK
jgi:hypothetical protein